MLLGQLERSASETDAVKEESKEKLMFYIVKHLSLPAPGILTCRVTIPPIQKFQDQ
jgi:hypothetical protein